MVWLNNLIKLVNLLKKFSSTNKWELHENFLEALWDYRIAYQTHIQATLITLTVGFETILPLEVEFLSLSIVVGKKIWLSIKYLILVTRTRYLDDIFLHYQINLELYHAWIIG